MKPSIVLRIVTLLTIATMVLTSCASTTVLRSNPPGARVFLDDQPVGVTPFAMTDTKIVGTTTRVRLEYPGLRPHYAIIQRNEKFDVLACIGGFLVLVPFLWIMGYKDEHYFDMTVAQQFPPGTMPPGAAPPPGGAQPVGVTASPNPDPASPDPVPAPSGGDAARADGLNEEGKTLYKNKDYMNAAAKFRQAIQLSPEARFYYNLCAALDLGNDLDGALAACGEVYTHGPSPELKGKTDERVKTIRAKRR
jgi:hypothetical protein